MPAPTDSNQPRDSGGVILLAGAGSSCHLGLPTLDDLLNRAVIGNDDVAARIRQTRQTIEAQPPRFRPAVFEELIVRIKYYLATAHMLRTDYTFRREIGQLPYDVDGGGVERKWKQSLTRCYRILLGEYGPNKIDAASKEFQVTNELFDTLAKRNGEEFHVYTTNYDCSFQVLAANSANLAFMTHIDSANGRFTERWHPGNPMVTPETRKIYVHRLHGCIGWFNISLAPDPGNIIKEVYGAGADLDIQDDDFLDLMCIKLLQAQLVGTNPAFASAFDEFCSDLRSVKTLLVWGFSFRDLEVVRAINHSFSERQTPLSILYVDPYLSENNARENIERTLMQAPIQPARGFRPRKIAWTPSDGLSKLVPAIAGSIGC